jgi:hypothetical protein
MAMDTLIGVPIGIGLSAACGFRVFVPLWVMNLASLTGHLHLGPGFEWMGNPYTTVAFGTATLVEVLAYYIPWLDHILDLIASPAAMIAGTVVTASMVMEMSPFLKWTLAIIAGGGAAAMVQGMTIALRTKSSALTAGMGNPSLPRVNWWDRLSLPSWRSLYRFSASSSSHRSAFSSPGK